MRQLVNVFIIVFVTLTTACGPNMDVYVKADRIDYVVKDNGRELQFVDQDPTNAEMDMLHFRMNGREYLFTQNTVGRFAAVAGSEESILLPLGDANSQEVWSKIQDHFLQHVRPAYISGQDIRPVTPSLARYLEGVVKRGGSTTTNVANGN